MFPERSQNVSAGVKTSPGNVPRTFWEGHNVEFFKGLGDVIWGTLAELSGRSRNV